MERLAGAERLSDASSPRVVRSRSSRALAASESCVASCSSCAAQWAEQSGDAAHAPCS